jgi:polysaccharide export outer membrane protein
MFRKPSPIGKAHVMPAALLVLVLGLSAAFVAPASAEDAYRLGAHDELQITIWGPNGLSGTFVIGADGSLTFPMLGRVPAASLTVSELQKELVTRLAAGFYTNPEVTVTVANYRSQKVYVLGEVRSPGTYTLQGDASLMDMLARAGSTTAGAGDSVVVRRRAGAGSADGPLNSDADAGNVITVSLDDFSKGALQHDVTLQDGDTIIVPPAKTVFVYGNVARPGEYPVKRNTTVLEALSLAGGVTQLGSTHRLKVVRSVDGKKRTIGVDLDDHVQGGDTIIVERRFF